METTFKAPPPPVFRVKRSLSELPQSDWRDKRLIEEETVRGMLSDNYLMEIRPSNRLDATASLLNRLTLATECPVPDPPRLWSTSRDRIAFTTWRHLVENKLLADFARFRDQNHMMRYVYGLLNENMLEALERKRDEQGVYQLGSVTEMLDWLQQCAENMFNKVFHDGLI
ncbi:MAG: hypothetical protein Q9159_006682 [Coniocarpon cinnabarinum]